MIGVPVKAKKDAREDASDIAPWFSTYNRHTGSPHSTRVHQFEPFPDHDFCQLSPWEDHVVLAHHGIEPFARAAGFDSVPAYLQHRIATAPKRGTFCQSCPNRECAAAGSF